MFALGCHFQTRVLSLAKSLANPVDMLYDSKEHARGFGELDQARWTAGAEVITEGKPAEIRYT